jgi:hypothetical protein
MSLAVTTASAVLALSKATWRVGVSLSTLSEDDNSHGFTIKDLATEVKSLGVECDLTYAILDEVEDRSKRASTATHNVGNRLWECLTMQVEESSSTIQELKLFVKILRGEETRFIGQAQRLRKLDKGRDKIVTTRTRVARHVDDFRFTLLLIDM